jgi:hypothetical protein
MLTPPRWSHSLLGLSNRLVYDFGVEPRFEPLQVQWPPADMVVLWVVDGMGAENVWEACGESLMPYLCQKASRHSSAHGFEVIDTMFPSTTATALATLHFAEPPALHGALGYLIWDAQRHCTINALTGADLAGHAVPTELYRPRRTIISRLEAAGIATAVIAPEIFRNSRLTAWMYDGAAYFGYGHTAEIPALLAQAWRFSGGG